MYGYEHDVARAAPLLYFFLDISPFFQFIYYRSLSTFRNEKCRRPDVLFDVRLRELILSAAECGKQNRREDRNYDATDAVEKQENNQGQINDAV